MTEQKTLEQSLKSTDTEETLDLLFYRPLGYRWALIFRNLGVSPNAVSLMSIVLGVAAGLMFYSSSLWINGIGMLLLVWANSFDSADGQLARMTGNFSPIGRALDGFAGDLWFYSIYLCICLRLFPQWEWSIFILAAAAGFSHAKQASTADYVRNCHLYFLPQNKRSELETSAEIKARYASLPWRGNFWQKAFLFFYAPYTKQQETLCPHLFTLVSEARRTPAAQNFAQDFRRESLPYMKYTNILTFNTRCIALFVSLAMGEPWLFFAFELTILNILLIYLLNRYERLCKSYHLRLRRDA